MQSNQLLRGVTDRIIERPQRRRVCAARAGRWPRVPATPGIDEPVRSTSDIQRRAMIARPLLYAPSDPHDVSRQPPALHDQQQPGLAVLLIDELGSAGVAAFPQGHVASRVAGTSKPVISFRVRVVRRQRGAGRGRLVAGPYERDPVPLLQRAKSLADDAAEVDEGDAAAVCRDAAMCFLVVEPANGSGPSKASRSGAARSRAGRAGSSAWGWRAGGGRASRRTPRARAA
jgi:hypothetical protein